MAAVEPTEFFFAAGSRFPESLGPLVGKELIELRTRLGHGLTDHDVLEHARAKPKSPIGQCFDWDTAAAAEAHWLRVAGDLLRAIKARIVVVNVQRPKAEARVITTRLMHHVRPLTATPDLNGMVYLPASETLSNFSYRTQLLEQVWQDVDRVRRKAEQFQELYVLLQKLEEAYREVGRPWSSEPGVTPPKK
jgi:hypothetical protein